MKKGYKKTGRPWLYATTVLTAFTVGLGLSATQTRADVTPTATNAVVTASLADSATSVAPVVATQMGSAVPTSGVMSAPVVVSINSTASVAPVVNSAALTVTPTTSSTTTVPLSGTSGSSAPMSGSSTSSSPATSSDLSTLSSTASTSAAISVASSAAANTSTVSSSTTASIAIVSSTAVFAPLAVPDISALASSLGSAYITTLGSAVSQLLSTVSVGDVLSALQSTVTAASPLAAGVPAFSAALTGATQLITYMNQAQAAVTALGLSTNVLNGLVAQGINGLITAVGQAAQGALSPILAQVPLIGGTLNAMLNPILSNLTGASASTVVNAIAGATGLTPVLNLLSSVIATLEPPVVAGLQLAANTLTAVINSALSGLNALFNGLPAAGSMLLGVASAIFSPLQALLGAVVNTGSAATNTPAVSTTNPTLSFNSAGTVIAPAAVGKLVLTNVTLAVGAPWSAKSSFVSATDAQGNPVPLTALRVSGSVNLGVIGKYNVSYSFVDPTNGQTVSGLSVVSVGTTADRQIAVTQASASLATAQASLASLQSQLSSMGSLSNLASTFVSTSNYPSSQTVVLPEPTSSFTPDVSQINSYFIQYVNQLRAANGQPAVSYSAAQQLFAQQRALQVMTNFSHTGSNGSTENIAASGDLVSTLKSNQEIAYFMVMDWYDESDNPEALGAGHYGHRANLLYGGPTLGIGYIGLPQPTSQGYDEFHTMEAPQYTSLTLYNSAVAMSNARTNPATKPLPNITFQYVDPTQYNALAAQIKTLQAKVDQSQAALAAAQSNLSAVV